MKSKIKLAVADFALPAPRRGSIDLYSGFGRGAEKGLEIHQLVQAERREEFETYQAEVPISQSFEWDGYQFEVSGRMDGYFDDETPRIEEIKTAFNVFELLNVLKARREDHPYILQLRTYGYFYWLKNKVVPDLNLHLVSSRNGSNFDYSVRLNVSEYEDWLERRSQELVEEAKAAEKRAERRIKAARDLRFPFEKPRSGQLELMAMIEEGIGQKLPMMIQAPTGLGKTLGVMFPMLREALGRGQKLVYLTPKNSQHGVAEDAMERLQEQGAKVKALTITAKSKMCFKNEPLCNPDFCEYAKDYYTKVADHKVLDVLSKKRGLTTSKFKKVAEEYQVCPFEIQLDAAKDADAVICDYNYVFAPRSAFGRLASRDFTQSGKPNLVIDEAHNLPARSMDYYSPSLSTLVLQNLLQDLDKIAEAFRIQARDLIGECIAVIEDCRPENCQSPMRIHPPIEEFLKQDEKLRGFLTSYLNSDAEIQAKDPVLALSFYWSDFTESLEYVASGRPEFFTSFHPHPAALKITCCDASEMLKSAYKDYEQIAAFSATLKPFEYYSRLGGLDPERVKTAEFASPFSPAHRKLLLIPQVSSKYSERERNAPRIAEVIHKISSQKRGNYFAFFPSFDFMERVYQNLDVPEGFQVMRQKRQMRREDVDGVLENLKDPDAAHILFAVQGGVFSEGVDYPGHMVIGAFIIGPPLPNFDLEREKMREYYQKHYGAGFDYAYTYPAMAKAVQAAGRVIRSETDRGLIVLMDSRFLQTGYAKSMPQDWFKVSPRELVSSRILSDIEAFWGEKFPNFPEEVMDKN